LGRQLFNWDFSYLSSISKWSEMLSEEFQLKKMDSILFEKYVKEMDSSCYDLWEITDNFLSNALVA
jgi:hypothetical protein